jgi:hypothetical protein
MKPYLRLRSDWEKFVTPEETEQHRQTIEKCNERGYVLKGEAKSLLKYNKKQDAAEIARERITM